MKTRKLICASLLLLLLGAARAHAQSAEDCSRLMDKGVYDKFQALNAESQFKVVKDFFSSNEFSSRQQAQAKAGSLGLNIEDVLDLNLNGTNSTSNFEQWKQELTRESYQQARSAGLQVQTVERISSALTNLVGICLTKQGVHAYVIPTADNQSFSVTVDYVPLSSERPTTTGTLTVTPASVASTCTPRERVINQLTVGPQGVSVSCRRLPTETVVIQASTADGTRVINYDAFVPPEPMVSFRVEPETIQRGNSARLVWEVANASRVEVDGRGDVTPSGGLTISPAATTNYQLIVTSLAGVRKTSFAALNVTEPLPPPPTLSGARVHFRTTDDDKDGDTNVSVSVICAGNTVAATSGSWGHFNDNSDSGWKDMSIIVTQPKAAVPGVCIAQLIESPNGHDEWHFNWTIELRFSDGTTMRRDWGGGNVDYDRTTIRQGF